LSGRRNVSEVAEAIEHLKHCGAEVLYCVSDVSSSADRDDLQQSVRDRFGRLDVLVNNAGVAPATREDLLDMTEASYERVMMNNLQGPFFLTQQFAEWMLEQKSLDNNYTGVIINVGSVSAEMVSLNRGEYCISKAGVSMMTQLFAARLSAHDISVFEIRPGIIKTNMTNAVVEKYNKLINEGDLCVIKRWGFPEDVGKVAAVMAAGKMPYCVGQVIKVDGGLSLARL
jgi:3-oxoacyl-[acyl-carrier protein] reductase